MIDFGWFLKRNLSSDSGEGEEEWLPDLDSNQDKLNQNQLCYRYTIGQTKAIM